MKRIQIDRLYINDYELSAKFTFLEETDDLDSSSEKNIKEFVKKLVREISTRFRGSEAPRQFLEGSQVCQDS